MGTLKNDLCREIAKLHGIDNIQNFRALQKAIPFFWKINGSLGSLQAQLEKIRHGERYPTGKQLKEAARRRSQEIWEDYRDSDPKPSFAGLGKKYGVTRARAHQIVKQYRGH